MIQVAEVPLTDAVRMMTETPARIIGIDHKKVLYLWGWMQTWYYLTIISIFV